MGSFSQNPQYQRLIELIFDEEKIVTAALAAHDLKISIGEASTLLNEFMKDSVNLKLKDLHPTYLLCGVLKDSNNAAVYLVKHEDLNEKRNSFDSISSEMVYSIQKGKQIDYNMIALTNSTYESCNDGLVVSKNCVLRNIKKKTLPSLPSTSGKEKPSFFKKTESQSKLSSEEKVKESLQPSQKQTKVNGTKPKQSGGIASFFAKAPAKTTQDKVTNEKFVDSIVPKVLEEPILDEKAVEDKNVINETLSEKETEQMDVDSQDDKPTMKKVQNQSISKKRKKENKNSNATKKRKRIQDVCDSDSSDIFDEDENDIIEKSDEEPEPIHTPVVNPTPVPKNKKRKAVDKTYVDEEGFIVTTTEYIYESASEDEENVVPKRSEEQPKALSNKKNVKEVPEIKSSKGKNKKPVSGKQQTLMSFFKKT